MQDPRNSQARSNKPWYRKAMEMAGLWKSSSSAIITSSNAAATTTLWRSTISSKTTTTIDNNNNKQHQQQKLKKCTSLRVATTFTRVCLCAPISSYTQVFQADVTAIPPRRSFSYPPASRPSSSSSSINKQPPPPPLQPLPSARISTEGSRKIFRGKSLTDDVLMRRFVVEEEAMMQVRRRNEMDIIRKRSGLRRRRLGPSPLSRVVLAEDQEY